MIFNLEFSFSFHYTTYLVFCNPDRLRCMARFRVILRFCCNIMTFISDIWQLMFSISSKSTFLQKHSPFSTREIHYMQHLMRKIGKLYWIFPEIFWSWFINWNFRLFLFIQSTCNLQFSLVSFFCSSRISRLFDGCDSLTFSIRKLFHLAKVLLLPSIFSIFTFSICQTFQTWNIWCLFIFPPSCQLELIDVQFYPCSSLNSI